MPKEILPTVGKVTVTREPIKGPPPPQQVRIFHKDGSFQDVFPIDAQEAVAGGEYSMEPPLTPLAGENVHKPIRPETVTGLMPEFGAPLAEIENKAAAAVDDDEPHASLRGPLPDDFPSRAALDAAGFGTYAKVRKLVAKGEGWHVDVPGIGEKTFSSVEDALKEK